MSSVNLLYQFWIHTELIDRMPAWFEVVFSTPSHHRVHHGTNVQYLDRNHAGILIVWDRLFGTFEPERAPVTYGLTKNLERFDPITIAFHEWVAMARDVWRASTWRDRVGYVLRPPGWSPDGSRQTAREMRAALRGGAQAV
ncbi:MAG: sterol desaturase family protein [Deltaproteobacteria bacterium]|nr:sterol desaturase family protein [Deltaproteobacteria bacterium]MBW2445302.1 sterol desaturase family protein [Deltaproteobacteria bacterium]